MNAEDVKSESQGTPPLEEQIAEGTAPEEVLEEAVTDGSTGPARRTQAGYYAARQAVKEQAAEVVAANAKAAQEAKKKAQSSIPTIKGAKAFATKAKEVEAQLAERRASRAEAKQ